MHPSRKLTYTAIVFAKPHRKSDFQGEQHHEQVHAIPRQEQSATARRTEQEAESRLQQLNLIKTVQQQLKANSDPVEITRQLDSLHNALMSSSPDSLPTLLASQPTTTPQPSSGILPPSSPAPTAIPAASPQPTATEPASQAIVGVSQPQAAIPISMSQRAS